MNAFEIFKDLILNVDHPASEKMDVAQNMDHEYYYCIRIAPKETFSVAEYIFVPISEQSPRVYNKLIRILAISESGENLDGFIPSIFGTGMPLSDYEGDITTVILNIAYSNKKVNKQYKFDSIRRQSIDSVVTDVACFVLDE